MSDPLAVELVCACGFKESFECPGSWSGNPSNWPITQRAIERGWQWIAGQPRCPHGCAGIQRRQPANGPEVPAGLGEYLTFDDAHQGPMLCIRNYHNDGPWLFYQTPNSWVTLRRAGQDDCDKLGVPHWMQVKQDAEVNP